MDSINKTSLLSTMHGDTRDIRDKKADLMSELKDRLDRNSSSGTYGLKNNELAVVFVMSSSRPAIKEYYDRLSENGVIPHGFPHSERVHSGVAIQRSDGKIVECIEGSGSKEGKLVLYFNRESTLKKLNNTGQLPDKNMKPIFGPWKVSYKVSLHAIDKSASSVRDSMKKIYKEFEVLMSNGGLPEYEAGLNGRDCQTVTHSIIKDSTGTVCPCFHESPYILGWGKGESPFK